MKLFFAKTCMNVVRLLRGATKYSLFSSSFNIQTMHTNLQTIKNYIWLRHPTKNSEAIYGLTNLNCTVKKEEIINMRKRGQTYIKIYWYSIKKIIAKKMKR